MLITLFTSVEATYGSGSFAVADLLPSFSVNITPINNLKKSYLYWRDRIFILGDCLNV